MKFKIDENLPVETAGSLSKAGYDAHSVFEEGIIGSTDSRLFSICCKEQRILVTLDLDFSDIRKYPPEKSAGIIILRLFKQDKNFILWIMQNVLTALKKESAAGKLWIVEEGRIRIRG